jgi:hypothetical protein
MKINQIYIPSIFLNINLNFKISQFGATSVILARSKELFTFVAIPSSPDIGERETLWGQDVQKTVFPLERFTSAGNGARRPDKSASS